MEEEKSLPKVIRQEMKNKKCLQQQH